MKLRVCKLSLYCCFIYLRSTVVAFSTIGVPRILQWWWGAWRSEGQKSLGR